MRHYFAQIRQLALVATFMSPRPSYFRTKLLHGKCVNFFQCQWRFNRLRFSALDSLHQEHGDELSRPVFSKMGMIICIVRVDWYHQYWIIIQDLCDNRSGTVLLTRAINNRADSGSNFRNIRMKRANLMK